MFATDFTCAPTPAPAPTPQRPQEDQRPYDSCRDLMAHPFHHHQQRDDGSVSPNDASSRSSTPGGHSSASPDDYTSCTSFPRHSTSRSTTSIQELSQHFTRHTIQPHRHSTPASYEDYNPQPPPGLFQPHDPTDLAMLSTTYAHRLARRKQSVRGLQCHPRYLHRVALLVEGMMSDDPHTPPATPPQPSTSCLGDDNGGESLVSMSAPKAGEAPAAGVADIWDSDAVRADVTSDARRRSMSSCRVGKELWHRESHDKILRPIRMRKRPRTESSVKGKG